MKSKFDAGADRRPPALRPSVFAVVAILSLGGCAALSDPEFPGMKGKVAIFEPIKEPVTVSKVFAALKCQLANAFEKIEKLKTDKKYSNNPLAKKFNIKGGTGVFKGKTQSIHANAATVSAIIPFTGFTGSTLGPDLGAALKGTTTATTTRTFSITPNTEPSGICDDQELDKMTVGDFVTKKVIEGFKTSVGLPIRPDKDSGKYKPYEPVFTDTKFEFETSFVVNVDIDGGVTSSILLSNPRLTSIGPGATADYDHSDTYTLTVTLNLGNQATTDPASGQPISQLRIKFCDVSDAQNGRIKLLCVEEPYREDRYRKLLSGLDGDLPYGISQIALVTALKQVLEKDPGERPEALEKALENAVKKVVTETTGKQWESLKETLKKLLEEKRKKALKEAQERLRMMIPDGKVPPPPAPPAPPIKIPDFYLGPAPKPQGY